MSAPAKPKTSCNCELKDRQWNPATGICKTCGKRYRVGHLAAWGEPPPPRIDRNPVRECARALVTLLNDPHPGVSAWNIQLAERMREMQQHAGEMFTMSDATAKTEWRCQSCKRPIAHDPMGTAAICVICGGTSALAFPPPASGAVDEDVACLRKLVQGSGRFDVSEIRKPVAALLRDLDAMRGALKPISELGAAEFARLEDAGFKSLANQLARARDAAAALARTAGQEGKQP